MMIITEQYICAVMTNFTILGYWKIISYKGLLLRECLWFQTSGEIFKGMLGPPTCYDMDEVGNVQYGWGCDMV